MGLKKRISGLGNRPSDEPAGERERTAPKAAKRRSETTAKSKPGDRRPRTVATDARRAGKAAQRGGGELLKIGREMLVIPAQIWLWVAEVAGAAVLTAWRRAVLPAIVALIALVRAAYRLALRHVTPARAVVAVSVVALAALAASQWLDYRGVSIGTDAYSGSVEAVAPAPEINREETGSAHAWVMVPLAAAGLVALLLALTGRRRAAGALVAIGAAAIVIAIAVDAPKGLDEGRAAIAYEGAEAHLLEGFWVQIAAGAVLIVCGLLLPRYLRPEPAQAHAPAGGAAGGGSQVLARAGARLKRVRLPRPGKRGDETAKGKRGVSGAST